MKSRILAACLAVLPAVTSAEPLVALGVGQQLVKFDSATPGTTTAQSIPGGNGALICLDFDLLSQRIFALGLTGQVSLGSWQVRSHMIDPETGQATQGVSTAWIDGGSNFMACDQVPSIPSNGRVFRVITANGGHQKFNADTTSSIGTGPATPPAFVAGDANEGDPLSIQALAYDNPSGNGTTSTLYGLDLTNGLLVRIGSVGDTPDSADTGKTTTIGPLGVTLAGGSTANFDISDTSGVAYATLQTAAGVGLYTINLATGAASLVGLIGDGTQEIRGLTAYNLPEEAGGGGGGGALDAPLLLGLLALGWRRRKIGRGERI